MTASEWIFAGFLGILGVTDIIAASALLRLLRQHRAALSEMRERLETFDVIYRAGGDAERLFVRPCQGSDSTWIDLVMTVPGLSLRMPIRPEEMNGFIADLRAQSTGLS